MKYLFLYVLIVVSVSACKKTNSPVATVDDDGPPAITAIGTQAGTPTTKNIGAAGGSISSPDGRIHLVIPAGALSTNTNISIQPVTNECPGGLGLAYDLLPNGTKFTIPATLTFNYSDSDVDGTNPYLLFIGYQDTAREWQINTEDKEVDTVAKTVSLDISHFTVWALKSIRLVSTAEKLMAGEHEGLFLLALHPRSTYVPQSKLSNWSVNGVKGGNSQDGTITPGTIAIYTAPSDIKNERYVTISVVYMETIDVSLKHGKILEFRNMTFSTKIKLFKKRIFDVKIELKLYGSSTVFSDTYSDGATVEVDVDGKTVTVPDWKNQYPTVTPTSGNDGVTNAVWIPGAAVGICNIATANGFVTVAGDSVAVFFTHLGTTKPKWELTSIAGGSINFIGGQADPGSPGGLYFANNDMVQVQNINLVTASIKYTITPRP